MDSQLGGLFDHPLEAVELDDRRDQRDAHRRGGRFQRLDRAEDHALAAGFHYFGEPGGVAVGDFESLAGFHAKDAREMAGLVAEQFGGAVADVVYEESSPCQVTIVRGRAEGANSNARWNIG